MIPGAEAEHVYFFPYLPGDRQQRFQDRMQAYPKTYRELAAKYFPDPSMISEGGDVSIATINDYRKLANKPALPDGWLGTHNDDGGELWVPYTAFVKPGPWPPNVGPLETANTMCFGLAHWQMLALTFTIQVLRVARLGYFGRPLEN